MEIYFLFYIVSLILSLDPQPSNIYYFALMEKVWQPLL